MGAFQNLSVLVTGGSRGIGWATATAFLREGAAVTISGTSETGLKAAQDRAPAGCPLATVIGDVGMVEGCEATVRAAVDAFGQIDVLVGNAGVYRSASIEQMTEELWDLVLDVNLKGTFFCAKFAAPFLRVTNGVIVTISSDAGLHGIEGGNSAYCAAKGGIVNLTRQLALDMAPEVRVNCVAPGYTDTNMLHEGLPDRVDRTAPLREEVPLGRVAQPEEIAEAILFAASARMVTGAIISIDGGISAGYSSAHGQA